MPAGQEPVDDLLLPGPETIKTEDVFQDTPLAIRDVVGLRLT